jgi:hypothetical protein
VRTYSFFVTFLADLQKIQRLKAQLASITDLLPGTSTAEASTSAAGLDSDSEDDDEMGAAELTAAEQAALRAVGLLEAEKKRTGKGKNRAPPPRKIVFKETKEEGEFSS